MSVRSNVSFSEENTPGVSLELVASRKDPLPPEVPFVFVVMGFATYWWLWVFRWDYAFPGWSAVVALLQVAYLCHLIWYVVEERLLMVKDLGFQVSSRTFLGKESLTFLPKEDVSSVFIHEYILGSRVCMSFALARTDDSRLCIAFKDVNPGLEGIKHAYLRCCELEPAFSGAPL